MYLVTLSNISLKNRPYRTVCCCYITVSNSIPWEMDLRKSSPTFINIHYFLQCSYTVFIFIKELNILDTMKNTSLPLFLEKFAIENSVCIIFISMSIFQFIICEFTKHCLIIFEDVETSHMVLQNTFCNLIFVCIKIVLQASFYFILLNFIGVQLIHMLCQFQVYDKVNQPYTHIYPLFFQILSSCRSLQSTEQSSLCY